MTSREELLAQLIDQIKVMPAIDDQCGGVHVRLPVVTERVRDVLVGALTGLAQTPTRDVALDALKDVAKYLESATPNLKSARLRIRSVLASVSSTNGKTP